MCLQKITRNEHFFATNADLGPHILGLDTRFHTILSAISTRNQAYQINKCNSSKYEFSTAPRSTVYGPLVPVYAREFDAVFGIERRPGQLPALRRSGHASVQPHLHSAARLVHHGHQQCVFYTCRVGRHIARTGIKRHSGKRRPGEPLASIMP